MSRTFAGRHPNLPLILGTIVLIALLLVMLFPQFLTSTSPYTIQKLRFGVLNEQLTIDTAPFPPSSQSPMGTDDLGRDIWSYIVYGTPTTILMGLIAALTQFLIALPLAMFGGTGHRGTKSFIQYSNLFLSAIPSLLLAVLVLQIDFFGGLNRVPSMVVFIAVLTAVAWPRLGSLLLERVESLNHEPFIMGEVALGKPRWQIAWENLLPHLLPEVLVLFFMEVARNLSMMMQLGLFGVFIGNLRLVLDSANGRLIFCNISYEPEWASLLSTSSTYLSVAPWTVLFPTLAFFVSVLGFNLVGEGLGLRLHQEKNRPLFDRKQFFISVFLISSLILLAFVLQPTPEALTLPRRTARPTAETIASVMDELNMAPGVGDSFVAPYDRKPAWYIENQTLEIRKTSTQTSQTFEPGRDFSFYSLGSGISGSTIFDATKMDLISMASFEPFENRVVLLDSRFYTDQFLESFVARASERTVVAGFLVVARDDTDLPGPIIEISSKVPVISITPQLAESLRLEPGSEVWAEVHSIPLGSLGQNVVGVFSNDPTTRSNLTEYIAVGLRYDPIDQNNSEIFNFNLELMRRLTLLEKNRRSFLFVFTDSPSGISHFSQNLPTSAHRIVAYLDLTGLGEPGDFSMSTRQAPITRQYAWALGKALTESLDRKGMVPLQLETVRVGAEYRLTNNEEANAMFWNAGVATIHLSGEPEDLSDLGTVLLDVIYKSNY